MPHLALFLLTCYGATTIVTQSKLFEPVRAICNRVSETLGYWSQCPMCMAVPIGMTFAAVWPPGELARPLAIVAGGFASSGLAWAVHVAVMRLGADKL